MDVKAVVVNGEVYYNGKDLTKALLNQARSVIFLGDKYLIIFIRRFILQLLA